MRDFDRAALILHAADTEIALVRSYMQAGEYRRESSLAGGTEGGMTTGVLLVVRADKHKATRFRLLETVKAYAEDRLVDTGEAGAVRDRHLAHFHRLAMVEGRKIWGSLDVGLRLRFDCPNITAAFEWAADHENWIIAGELLTASYWSCPG